MIEGIISLRNEVQKFNNLPFSLSELTPKCLHLAAQEIAPSLANSFSFSPKLILTSPPYPGVHVLYHRWQVDGRKETPAPYWIANCIDGNGASFYTFGTRKQKNLKNYFQIMKECYKAISEIAEEGTWLVQLVAFSAVEWQLPLFLTILKECDFVEIPLRGNSNIIDGRSWRTVPNRKFYADYKGGTSSSREILLIHRRI